MDYEEEQSMEIEALQSIYMEDFEEVSASPHEFIVHLVPSPGADEENHGKPRHRKDGCSAQLLKSL